MSEQFGILAKIPSAIKRLEVMYRNYEKKIFHEIICNTSIFVREAISYDNCNGGMTGHGVVFFLGEDVIEKIKDFDSQRKICEKLLKDLRECINLPNEFVESVSIELFDDNDQECGLAIKALLGQPIVNPDSLTVWKFGYIRLFISHRDDYKREASELANYLEGYGISSFVAHDTIEPMEEWQHTIKKALQTMEVMLVFITDNFFESHWTNQEIGVALARGIPIISLKLQKTEPKGFISHIQAIPSKLSSTKDSVDGIYQTLIKKLGQEERIRKSAVQAFVKSPNFDETKNRFTRLQSLEKITDIDIQQIIEGFMQNDQLHGSIYLTNQNKRLISFLNNRTGKNYTIQGKQIKILEEENDDEIPF